MSYGEPLGADNPLPPLAQSEEYSPSITRNEQWSASGHYSEEEEYECDIGAEEPQPGPSRVRNESESSDLAPSESAAILTNLLAEHVVGMNSALRQYLFAQQDLLTNPHHLNLLRLRLRLLRDFGPIPEDQQYLLLLWLEDGHIEDEFLPALEEEQKVKNEFNHGFEITAECTVCLEVKKLYKRRCCETEACNDCLKEYLEAKIGEGILRIQCIGLDCNAVMFRDEISARVSVNMKEKYYKFLIDANKDPKVKTCPNCSNIHEISEEDLASKTKYGLLMVCPKEDCKMAWCFICHAPWHAGIKCKDFSKGDKLVMKWAKEKHYGNVNAQKCPNCKIFIERKGGCDHMVCSKCDQSFCYRCGSRYRDLKFFGHHQSRFSPVGCKYIFKPNQPILRRVVRGSVFGAKLLGGLFLVGLGAAAVGVLIGTSVIILPAVGGYKYYQHRKIRKRMKRFKQEKVVIGDQHATEQEFVDWLGFEREIASLKTEAMMQSGEATAQTDRPGESVHVGIQTSHSQQVDVTVHNPPCNQDAKNAEEETVNSEIRMNISDEHGQVTMTTAEISHNAKVGDGSEAEIVLHVKTSYLKGEKEPKDSKRAKEVLSTTEKENVEQISLNKSEENDLDHEIDGFVAASEGKAVQTCVAESKAGKNADAKPPVMLTHKRAHSTGSLKKQVARKQFEYGSVSAKNKKSLTAKEGLESQTGSPVTLPDSDQGQGRGLTNPTESNKPLSNVDEKSQNDVLTQSGCFMKLLGKKLTALQLDKDKMATGKSEKDVLPAEFRDCPDVVSCALEAEMKAKDSRGGSVDQDGDADWCIGPVAMETHTTPL